MNNTKQKSRRYIVDRIFVLARLKGLEPLTYWFVASHSIQLSYKRIWDEKAELFHRRKVSYHKCK